MVFKRFRRSPAVIIVLVCISTIICLHLYNFNLGYGLIGPKFLMQDKGSIPEVTSSREKVKHIVFVKVHKAASTTLMNIFVRFALRNNLTMMIPRRKNILNEHGVFDRRTALPSLHTTYDMLCNHVIFNKSLIKPLFPADTNYIGILRDPFDQTLSAFMYYKYVYPIPYLVHIQGENPVAEYLKHPQKYEPRDQTYSFTNNRMSVDLGYPNVTRRNQTEAASFIKDLEKTFKLILIAEYFDESVILMKRLLNWDMKDVLYFSSNSLKKGHDLKFSPEDHERHEKWAWLDHAVYNHFYQLLWDKIHEQGKNFFREVQIFKNIGHKWQNFCALKPKPNARLKINATEWNSEFYVSAEECKLATTDEIPLMDKVRMDFYLKIRRRGIVLPYVSPRVLTNVFKHSQQKNKKVHHLIETKHLKWTRGAYSTTRRGPRKTIPKLFNRTSRI